MRQKPKISSDSFWGDLANALALRPVYRQPVNQPQPAPTTPEPVFISRPQEQQEQAEPVQEATAASSQQAQEPAQAEPNTSPSDPDTDEDEGAVDTLALMTALEALLSHLERTEHNANAFSEFKKAISRITPEPAPALRQQSTASPQPASRATETSALSQQEVDDHIAAMMATPEMREPAHASTGDSTPEWLEPAHAPAGHSTSRKFQRKPSRLRKNLTEKQLSKLGLAGIPLTMVTGIFQNKSFPQVRAELKEVPSLELRRQWNKLLDDHQAINLSDLKNTLREEYASLLKTRKAQIGKSPAGKARIPRTAGRGKRIVRTRNPATWAAQRAASSLAPQTTREGGNRTIVSVFQINEADKHVVSAPSEGSKYVVITTDHHGEVRTEPAHAAAQEEEYAVSVDQEQSPAHTTGEHGDSQ